MIKIWVLIVTATFGNKFMTSIAPVHSFRECSELAKAYYKREDVVLASCQQMVNAGSIKPGYDVTNPEKK